VWHASVAYLDMHRQYTPRILELPPSTVRVIARTAKSLIADVGQFPSSLERVDVALHYRRAITDEEYQRLPAAWCEIPAVHEAGRGIILEENT
jgi:hypothetical protein